MQQKWRRVPILNWFLFYWEVDIKKCQSYPLFELLVDSYQWRVDSHVTHWPQTITETMLNISLSIISFNNSTLKSVFCLYVESSSLLHCWLILTKRWNHNYRSTGLQWDYNQYMLLNMSIPILNIRLELHINGNGQLYIKTLKNCTVF